MSQRRLSEEEAAAVFRRASQLDEDGAALASGGTSGAGGLEREAVERAAVEVGLTPAAVHQAMAELDAGVLASLAGVDDGGLATVRAAVRGGWPEQIVPVDRVIAGQPRATESELETWLKRQTFRLARRRGPVSVWEPAEGLTATVLRGTDIHKRLRLKSVTGLTLCVLPHPDGARVRIELDFARTRRSNRAGAFSGLTAGGLAVVGGVAGAVLGPDAALMAMPIGAAVAGGTWFGAQHELRKTVGRAVRAVELRLDELEHG